MAQVVFIVQTSTMSILKMKRNVNSVVHHLTAQGAIALPVIIGTVMVAISAPGVALLPLVLAVLTAQIGTTKNELDICTVGKN